MTGLSEVIFCEVILLNFGLARTFVRATLPEPWIDTSEYEEAAGKSTKLLRELQVELCLIKDLAGERNRPLRVTDKVSWFANYIC